MYYIYIIYYYYIYIIYYYFKRMQYIYYYFYYYYYIFVNVVIAVTLNTLYQLNGIELTVPHREAQDQVAMTMGNLVRLVSLGWLHLGNQPQQFLL